MFRPKTLCILCLLIPGCTRPAPSGQLPDYHGKTRADVISKLGTPDRDEAFLRSEAAGEFRGVFFSRDNPGEKIEEMTWKDGDYWNTLWLRQKDGVWKVVDSCRWHKDDQF